MPDLLYINSSVASENSVCDFQGDGFSDEVFLVFCEFEFVFEVVAFGIEVLGAGSAKMFEEFE